MVTVRGTLAEFRFFRPNAQQVTLVGDFNEWRKGELTMVRGDDGYWHAVVKLPPGSYKFRYLADNAWYADYAAFGLEYGPFGYDSIVHVPAVAAMPKRRTRPAAPAAVAGRSDGRSAAPIAVAAESRRKEHARAKQLVG